MPRSLPDPRIPANGVSAVHNIRGFIEADEFARGVGVQSWNAALLIAADLTELYRRHMAERISGVRRW
jgi:hypothetical protein